MVIWTVQDLAVWKEMERSGRYTADERYLCMPESEDGPCSHSHYAYLWMVEQMKRVVGPAPKGVRYPIWAWYKRYGSPTGKPDMRACMRQHDRPQVRLKLDVPDWDVLISDFDDWHFALNYWYLPEDEGDSDSFDAWCASRGLEFSKLQDWRIDGCNYQEARRRIERSWTRLLGVDRNAGFGGDWSKRTLQATFWELKRDQVLSHELFMPRADATGR